MEATSAAFGPKAPGPHSAHALPPQSGRLSGGAGGKGVPANFAGLVFSRPANLTGRPAAPGRQGGLLGCADSGCAGFVPGVSARPLPGRGRPAVALAANGCVAKFGSGGEWASNAARPGSPHAAVWN